MPEWTAPKTWVADEDILAADLNANVRDNPEHLHDWLGMLGAPQESSSDSAGFTAETTLLTLNVTIPAGARDIKLSAEVDLESSVAGDTVLLKLKEGSTVLREEIVDLRLASTRYPAKIWERLAAPASGAHTYTLTAARNTGTGTITARGASTRKMRLIAEAL